MFFKNSQGLKRATARLPDSQRGIFSKPNPHFSALGK